MVKVTHLAIGIHISRDSPFMTLNDVSERRCGHGDIMTPANSLCRDMHSHECLLVLHLFIVFV